MINKLKAQDIGYIRELVEYAGEYIRNRISDMKLILKMNEICTTDFGYYDPKLVMFKNIWSTIGDIEDEVKEGVAKQEEVDEYVVSRQEDMKKACHKLIEEYTPILAELERKYKADA